ncbi:type 2 DNA topoisomerase 6 subunit B-like isoform X4 [Prionailurus iriomotensis]
MILKYLIIHWKCETGVSNGALLEGQLVISMEALNSNHQENTLHCVTTIASAGSTYGGLVLKKFIKEIQSILPGFSAKLNWTSEEASSSQDISGVTPFQMIFEVDEKPRTLMTDSLVIKNFLRRIIMVHPKIRFNFSVKVNGILSLEIFGDKERTHFEPVEWNCSCYKLSTLCECLPLILPSQKQPTTTVFEDTSFFIDWKKYHLCLVPNLDLSLDRGNLVLPDVSYQVESSEGDQSQNMDSQGQTLLLFLFVDFHSGFPVQRTELWSGIKKCYRPCLALTQYLNYNISRAHTLLTVHLSAILMESHSVVQDSIQVTVDQALEQYHQAAKDHQKLQASLSVAVNSIMSIVTGSTSSSFRKICFQALQFLISALFEYSGTYAVLELVLEESNLHNPFMNRWISGMCISYRDKRTKALFERSCLADTQEFGTKLHKSFHEITQHRFLPHCSCEVKQQLLPEKNAEQSTEDAHENSSPELLTGTSEQVENKRLKRGSLRRGMEETQAFHSARAPSQLEAAARRTEPAGAFPTPSGSRASPGGGLEDSLWLQEVSNLSEWLDPGPEP